MVFTQRSLLNVDERILLYLLGHHYEIDNMEAPEEFTTEGIADAVLTDKYNMSYYINKLKTKKYIDGNLAHVNNKKRKQKVYYLTYEGRNKAQKLLEDLKETEISIAGLDEQPVKLKFAEVTNYLIENNVVKDISDLEICKHTNYKRIFDASSINFKLDQFVDFTDDALKHDEFFGRDEEIKTLTRWIDDKNLYQVITVYGIAGIGKTTLVSHLIDNYRGSKHLFWHDFCNWDTVRSLLLRLAEFLSKVGQDKLVRYINFDRPLKQNVILKLLKEEMEDHNIILIFDDFHKAKDKIKDFVTSLIEILNPVNNIKFLILSRYIIPFYDQDKVLIRKSIAELEVEGLDFNSSIKILQKKGFPQNKYRSIYRITAGNPLLLEIFEHNRKSKRYIYEEIFTQLSPAEQKVMEVLSTGRTPVPYHAFFINNEIIPDTIDLLVQKFVIKENSDGNYDTHEFVKEFFYKRLPPIIKTRYHDHFAKFYRARKTPKSDIEAIYHYMKSLQYQDSIDLAIKLSPKITGNGLSEKLLDVLEELPEEEVPLPQWADILILKARLCFTVGDWDSSIRYYQRSIEIGTEVGKDDNVANAYFEVGKILEERNIIEEALKSYEKAWEIYKKLRNKKLVRDSKRGIVRLRMKIRNVFSKLK